ncbi:MAG: putative zinc-binding protein [Chloroflexi bacterium]|nr:putative zinc-binding protein [Chloroflexota bacterium]
MDLQKQQGILPKVGLFACFSGGSNTGSLTGMAALEVVKRLGSELVGVCSLPAVLNQVPRQSVLVRRIETLIVIDGCHNECARQLLAGIGIAPDVYLNLETDLHINKQGPFSSLAFTTEEIDQVAQAIVETIEKALKEKPTH